MAEAQPKGIDGHFVRAHDNLVSICVTRTTHIYLHNSNIYNILTRLVALCYSAAVYVILCSAGGYQ